MMLMHHTHCWKNWKLPHLQVDARCNTGGFNVSEIDRICG
jgi:hypothetical protein